jgi:hypothetical protein
MEGMMRRRLFLLSTLGISALCTTGMPTPALASRKQIVYISALNCQYCYAFEVRDQAAFVAKVAALGYSFRKVQTSSFRNIRIEAEWPSDLRPLLKQFDNINGTPRFLFIENGRIVRNEFGSRKVKAEVGL